jgi:CBS-domain-containing membrane protein
MVATNRTRLHEQFPGLFGSFEALYEIVRRARNDAMHSGSYARRATAKALELCLMIEDGLMAGRMAVRTVADYMVRDAVAVEPWAPVAKARQVMLLHSFSNVPVRLKGNWQLITEVGIAKFLRAATPERNRRLGLTIEAAEAEGLELASATTVRLDEDADAVLTLKAPAGANLWLVLDEQQALLGVLTPFELM